MAQRGCISIATQLACRAAGIQTLAVSCQNPRKPLVTGVETEVASG